MSSMSMEHEQSQSQEGGFHQEGSGSPWMDNGNSSLHMSHHNTPVHEFNGFSFAPLPMEPIYTTNVAPPRTTHQQLQPLITPQWPSMLTSHSTYQTPIYPATTMPVSQTPTPVSAIPTVTTSSRPSSTPRKTLTDADRRRMCLYHEEHPNTKQTEIGAMFGVERSTVSKVLRNKEKYLYQDDGSRSPIKRTKGKYPDIERALSNWVRNHQKQGLPLSDAMITEKAQFFARSVGTPESHLKANSASWIEKFKIKNNLLGHRSSRKSSIVSNPDLELESPVIDMKEENVSPTDTTNPLEPGPIGSRTPQQDNHSFSSIHRPFHSQSNPALSTIFTDSHNGPFSAGPGSPTSSFFSPDSAGPSPFIPASSNFHRPRSQTFPALSMEPYISPPSSEPLTPKYLAGAVLDSPMSELSNPLGIDSSISAQTSGAASNSSIAISTSHHHNANQNQNHKQHINHNHSSSMPPPATTHQSLPPLTTQHSPISPATTLSSPGSPSQEEARRALELVIQFFQNQPTGLVEPEEYLNLGRLMEKLRLAGHHHQQGQGIGIGIMGGGEMPGGMHRMTSQEFIRKVE